LTFLPLVGAPPGLSISPTGLISGTVPAGTLPATFNVTITVQDAGLQKQLDRVTVAEAHHRRSRPSQFARDFAQRGAQFLGGLQITKGQLAQALIDRQLT
jgi:hypothetical protein